VPSFSYGITEVTDTDSCVDTVLARVDREMYACKQARRATQRTAVA
jgi:hypothetical protein